MPSFDPLRIPEPPDPISKLVEELIVLGAVLAFQLGTYTEHRAAELFLSQLPRYMLPDVSNVEAPMTPGMRQKTRRFFEEN